MSAPAGYEVWGWGDPADAPRTADLEALAPLLEATTGVAAQPPLVPVAPAPLPPSRRLADLPGSLRELASVDDLDRARHGTGRAYRDLVRGMAGRVDSPPDLVLRPRTEQDVADRPRLGHRHGCAGRALRRRQQRRRRGRAAGARRRRQPRPVAAGRAGRGRHRVAGRAPARRDVRTGGRGGPGRPRPDLALLPAVVRALDRRRLGGDPRRGPLLQPADARRRPRRVGPGHHARRAVGVAAAAGFRRRTLTGPDAAGERGHPRRRHLRLAARAAQAVAPLGRDARWFLRRRADGGAAAAAVRAAARDLPAGRPRRGRAHRHADDRRGRTRARPGVARRPARGRRRARAGRLPRRRAAGARVRRARARPARPGGRPSCGRRTCASPC